MSLKINLWQRCSWYCIILQPTMLLIRLKKWTDDSVSYLILSITDILERRKMRVSRRSLALRRYWLNCSRRPKRSRDRVRQRKGNARWKNGRKNKKWKRKGKLTRTALKSLNVAKRGNQKICLNSMPSLIMSLWKRQRRTRRVQTRNRRRRKRRSHVCINSDVDTTLDNQFTLHDWR